MSAGHAQLRAQPELGQAGDRRVPRHGPCGSSATTLTLCRSASRSARRSTRRSPTPSRRTSSFSDHALRSFALPAFPVATASASGVCARLAAFVHRARCSSSCVSQCALAGRVSRFCLMPASFSRDAPVVIGGSPPHQRTKSDDSDRTVSSAGGSDDLTPSSELVNRPRHARMPSQPTVRHATADRRALTSRAALPSRPRRLLANRQDGRQDRHAVLLAQVGRSPGPRQVGRWRGHLCARRRSRGRPAYAQGHAPARAQVCAAEAPRLG